MQRELPNRTPHVKSYLNQSLNLQNQRQLENERRLHTNHEIPVGVHPQSTQKAVHVHPEARQPACIFKRPQFPINANSTLRYAPSRMISSYKTMCNEVNNDRTRAQTG